MGSLADVLLCSKISLMRRHPIYVVFDDLFTSSCSVQCCVRRQLICSMFCSHDSVLFDVCSQPPVLFDVRVRYSVFGVQKTVFDVGRVVRCSIFDKTANTDIHSRESHWGRSRSSSTSSSIPDMGVGMVPFPPPM